MPLPRSATHIYIHTHARKFVGHRKWGRATAKRRHLAASVSLVATEGARLHHQAGAQGQGGRGVAGARKLPVHRSPKPTRLVALQSALLKARQRPGLRAPPLRLSRRRSPPPTTHALYNHPALVSKQVSPVGARLGSPLAGDCAADPVPSVRVTAKSITPSRRECAQDPAALQAWLAGRETLYCTRVNISPECSLWMLAQGVDARE